MSTFSTAYAGLLIKQYWEKPKANAEIDMKSLTWEKVLNAVIAFKSEFDVDLATGKTLDIIGRIVGIPRSIPFIIPKVAFGFSDNSNAMGFSDKFNTLDLSAPFLDAFESAKTDLQLDDNTYRFFIKAKIAFNNSSAYMASDTKVSIQSAVSQIFSGEAYVADNYNMTLDLYVTPVFNTNWLLAIEKMGLLPRPQAVRYAQIIHAVPGKTFGFFDSQNTKGFSDKFDPLSLGGIFASKVI